MVKHSGVMALRDELAISKKGCALSYGYVVSVKWIRENGSGLCRARSTSRRHVHVKTIAYAVGRYNVSIYINYTMKVLEGRSVKVCECRSNQIFMSSLFLSIELELSRNPLQCVAFDKLFG